MTKTLLLELSPLETTTGLNTTIRLTDRGAPASVTLMDAGWLPAIVDDIEFNHTIWADGSPAPLSTSFGAVTISLEHVLRTHDLTRLYFDGAVATIWIGDTGAPFASFAKAFTGAMGPLVRDDDRTAKITLLGPESALARDLLTQTFQGTGNIEGTAEMVGRLKPWSIGAVTNVEPILIDPASLIYMVDDASPIWAVYENALSNDTPAATLASYSALKAATIAPGKWMRAPGLLRLGSQPSGKITADAGNASTVNATIVALLRAAGIADAKIGPSIRAASVAYNLYIMDQTTILEAARTAAFAAGQYLIADASGVWHLAPFVSTKAPGRLAADQSSDPIVLPDSIRALTAAAPAWRVKVGHTRIWSVHSSAEISPAIRDQAAQLEAIAKAAVDAGDVADAAFADAVFARNRVDNQATDNVLDRTEKLQVVRDFEGYTAERSTLIATGQGLGVTTEVDGYVAAYASLKAYLEGLTPAYNDTSADTVIDGTTYRAKLTGYLLARSILANANANHAAERANWTSVADRPRTLTALDLTAGQKLDTVATGADVTKDNTSKDTAAVGGRPAGDVVTAIDRVATIASDVKKALDQAQLLADKEIAASTAPGLPAGFVWSTILTDAGATVSLTWNAVSDAIGYEVEAREQGGGAIVYRVGGPAWKVEARRGVGYSARVRATKPYAASGWADAGSQLAARDEVAPVAANIIDVEVAYQSADIRWNNAAETDLAFAAVYLYDASGNSLDQKRVAAAPGGGSVIWQGLAKATTYQVRVQLADSSGNLSPLSPVRSFTTAGGVSAADFAPGLSPTATVASLPNPAGYLGAALVFNQSDSKLYSYQNGAWVEAVAKAVGDVTLGPNSVDASNLKDGAVTGPKLAAGSVTANSILAGTITSAQIASGAILARNLAIGNPDSIVTDSDYRDAAWWSGNVADPRLSVSDIAFPTFRRGLAISPGGGIDVSSAFFPAEAGATYRVTTSVFLQNFNGVFKPLIHVPGQFWYGVKNGQRGVDPGDFGSTATFSLSGGDASYHDISTILENPVSSATNQIQFRFNGSWTGTVYWSVRIVRVSDTTLIKDGSITTDKIVVGSLNGDRIAAGTLDASKITAGSVLSGSVTVNGSPLGAIQTAPAHASAVGWSSSYSPGNYTAFGSKITKTGAANAWDTNMYTTSPLRNGATIKGRFYDVATFIGLANATSAGNYGAITWAWHRSGDGNMYIFEGGTAIPVATAADLGADVVDFTVTYDGRKVRYYSNEFLRREVDAAPDQAIWGVVAIAPPGNSVDRVQFYPSADNSLNRADPASRINAATTQIDPGKILITGSTTLANWRQGGDETKIAGGSISANTISANKLTIGNRGISFIGLNFEWNPSTNWVSWSEGYIYYTDDAGNPTSNYIVPGNTGGASAHQFIYWNKGSGRLDFNQDNPALNGDNRIMIASWWGNSNLNVNYGGTIINGDRITTGTIDADRIKANTVLASSVIIGGSTVGAVTSKVAGIQAGATVGAPAGTYIGNQEAQTVTNWAYTGSLDPANRMNSGGSTLNADRLTGGSAIPNNVYISGTSTTLGTINSVVQDPAYYINLNTTTINGGKITTGSITAGQIAAGSIDASRLNVGSLSAITANIGFLVSYNGQGGRVERDGNGTRIYGNNGTLRVKIGF